MIHKQHMEMQKRLFLVIMEENDVTVPMYFFGLRGGL
jgi:hypothetical protein